MKQLMLKLMWRTGAFAPFRLAHRNRALILTYHRFSADGANQTVAESQFRWQLQYLTSRYHVVPLQQIAAGQSLPPRAVAITIDDGYRDAYEIAFPLLKKFGLPATLFVVTDFLDGRIWLWPDKVRWMFAHTSLNEVVIHSMQPVQRFQLNDETSRRHAAAEMNERLKSLPEPMKEIEISRLARLLKVSLPSRPTAEYAPVTWDEACEMDRAGVEIGSHTVTHPILTRVSNEQLRRELRASRERLEEKLQRAVKQFCYPNGDYDERVRAAVAKAGYECAVTTTSGFNDQRSDRLALRRIHTAEDQPHFAQSTSGFEQVRLQLAQRG